LGMKIHKIARQKPHGFTIDKVPTMTRGQLLNMVSLELTSGAPNREMIWQGINSLAGEQGLDPSFKVGASIMEKVKGIIWSQNYPEISKRKWPTEEDRMAAYESAKNLLRSVMSEFV
jgi:hypothetical protein